MKKKCLILLMLLALLMLLSGCFAGEVTYTPENPAGVLAGIWHGWIAPVSLVFGFFDSDIRLYEPDNTGWLYDIAFYLAIVGGFGTLSLLRRRKKK